MLPSLPLNLHQGCGEQQKTSREEAEASESMMLVQIDQDDLVLIVLTALLLT
jgi:hypothetical protein